MTEGLNWSVVKWIREKKRVRKAADKANNVLWAMQAAVKKSWPDDLKLAYQELAARDGHRGPQKAAEGASAIGPELKLLARAVKHADDEAYQAHLDAEDTFDKADKRLSTSLAREGARKAIRSWELYEAAIAKAEAATSGKAAKKA